MHFRLDLMVHLTVQSKVHLSLSKIEGSSDGIPTFEVEIKGPLGVTIELDLKMHIVMHFLVHKIHQSDLIKDELEGDTVCCTWRFT